MKKSLLVLILSLLSGLSSFGQEVIVDEIVATVGDNIILRSELLYDVEQARKNYGDALGEVENLECAVLRQLILKELLLYQAKLDSIPMSDDQVNSDIENKLRYYIGQAGSVEALEKFLGMSLVEYKEQMRPIIREQLLVKAMRQNITGGLSASPKEVKAFFNSIPKDSLPLYNAEIELGQIVAVPKVGAEAKAEALKKIQSLKKRLEKGESFKLLASVWSEDKGSARNGGEMPEFGRKEMVPEFERAAFKLKAGELSDIVETQYGYHIIQSIYRKGEKAKVRHILIKPKIKEVDLIALKYKMDSVLTDLRSGDIEFCEAVNLYSDDDRTKANCGFFTNQVTGMRSVEVNTLDPSLVAAIEGMKVGEYSEPKIIRRYDNSNAFRILYMKGEIPPHRASLDKDYQKLQILALEDKKSKELDKWVEKVSKDVFIVVHDNFVKCEDLTLWLNN